MMKFKYFPKADNSHRKNLPTIMNDLCIRCGKETEYPIITPVDKRFCYVSGSGQMCEDCYREVLKVGSDKAETQLEYLRERGVVNRHLL